MKHSLKIVLLALSVLVSTPVSAKNKHTAHKAHFNHKHHVSHTSGNSMTGVASWYGYESTNRSRHRVPRTASGEIFNPARHTAAHRSLPFGTKVLVTNLKNQKTVIVVINDRGPFVRGRIIDLSKAAAIAIGISGTQKVSLEIM